MDCFHCSRINYNKSSYGWIAFTAAGLTKTEVHMDGWNKQTRSIKIADGNV